MNPLAQALDEARNIIAPEIDEAQVQFVRKVGVIQADHAKRGMLGTMYVAALARACETEMSARAAIIWGALSESTTAIARRPFDGLVGDIARAFETHLQVSASLLAETVRQAGRPADSNVTLLEIQRLNNRAQGLISKYTAKARAFVDNRGVSQDDQAPGGTTIHFHGPNYGPVATGDAASITQTINVGPARDEILAAITRLESLLPSVPPGHEAIVADVKDVATEVRTEVARARPNPLRISGLLSIISSTIRTTAALKPAYDLMRQVLAAHFGIALPPIS
jgi:hypothetical protein